MIITTGGIKGGCGKTTLATNIAVHLSNQGRDVLLSMRTNKGLLTSLILNGKKLRGGQLAILWCVRLIKTYAKRF